MANSLAKNTSEFVLQTFLPGFMDSRVLTKTVDRQLLSGALNPTTGDTVQFKRPHQYNTQRTADGDITGGSASNIISATATATVSDYITVEVEWGQKEEALELNQLEKILRPIQTKIITVLEQELATKMYTNAGLVSGNAGTAIDAWSDIASAGSYLESLGVDGNNYCVVNPYTRQNLADAQSGLSSGRDGLVDEAWEKAKISKDFGGMMAYTSNALASYTTGTEDATLAVNGTPDVTYQALKDTYQLTVSLDGGTASGTLLAGTQLEFPDISMVNQQNKNVILDGAGSAIPFVGTVTGTYTANGSGEYTNVVISGAPIFDVNNPQYNTVSAAVASGMVVNILGAKETSFQPALAYHGEGFIGMGTVDLPALHTWDSTVINEDGFSIRCTKYSDARSNKQMMRFDILPSFCIYNPLMGMQVYGN